MPEWPLKRAYTRTGDSMQQKLKSMSLNGLSDCLRAALKESTIGALDRSSRSWELSEHRQGPVSTSTHN